MDIRMNLKGSMLAVVPFAVLVILLGLMGPVACSRMSEDGAQQIDAAGPVPSNPEELLAELRTHRDRMDEVTGRMMQRLDEFNATRTGEQRTIQFSEIFTEELSPEQRDVLDTMLADEQDISYRALLEKIIADRDNIRSLQDKTIRLEQALPDHFVLAKKGNTHYGLSSDYLRNEAGLDAKKTAVILKDIDLTDELLPGNKVWLFYDAEQDTFRTYVTQGEAGRTPLAVRRAMQRELLTERDAAKAAADMYATERDAARSDVTRLQQIKTGLESDVSRLSRTRSELEASVSRLSSDLAFRKNSLFYHAANIHELKDQGVLSRVLKKLEDMREVNFDAALDLRRDTTITLRPEVYGLARITKVKMLPQGFEEGRDYTVTPTESGNVKITIQETDLFRGKQVLLAVGGKKPAGS